MKKILFLIVLMACSSRNTDWDSGAQKQQTYHDHQRQEQVENTRMQDTIPSEPGTERDQPY